MNRKRLVDELCTSSEKVIEKKVDVVLVKLVHEL